MAESVRHVLHLGPGAVRLIGTVGVCLGLASGTADAQDQVRIGLATKAWFPTLIAETTQREGYFGEEGLDAELTVYQSGAEAVTAMIAGAADVIGSSSSVTASGHAKGLDTKLFGLLGSNNYGWQLLVPADSDIKEIADLDGKKVGITSAGSLSDMLARWTMSERGVSFDSIPLGGSGLIPNLLSGNVDAAVVYSPLSFQVLEEGTARSLLDYGTAMPEHYNSGWGAMSEFLSDQPDVAQRTLNALNRGVKYLQDNRDEAVAIIAKSNNVPESVAEKEWENVFKKLSSTGEATPEMAEAAMDLAKLTGLENMPEASVIWTDEFTPAPK